MNKTYFILIVGIYAHFVDKSESKWAPAGNRLKSKWTAEVNPEKVWPEYPRPQLVRTNWQNLNGLWEYSITNITAAEPTKHDGEILVPFPVESSLSGVQKVVTEQQSVWYKRQFTTDVGPNELLILNFGAVDYHSQVFINAHSVGEHKGGYDSFSFDVTKFLNPNKENTLVLKVIDTTGHQQPKGKQDLKPHGTFYSAVTGIWRTVFLEKVPKEYIVSLKIVPDVDTDSVHITVNTNNASDISNSAYIEILDKTGKVVSAAEKASVNKPNQLKISNPMLWSTTDPYLYDLKIKLGNDSITSYFGLRKIEKKKDKKGFNRFFLNNKPIFMYSPLDQGYWPDGIYVPPTDEAMKYDIEMEQKIGFNTARKHVKIENDRWYYWCDKLGHLVWQDFPSAFGKVTKGAKDNTRDKVDSDQIELEMERMVSQHYNHPSIVVWVPFNEGWGQYDTQRIVGLFRKWDPTRLINEASGWNDHNLSEILDHHSYPFPNEWKMDANRISVQGEFGGVGLSIKGHEWDPEHKQDYHYTTVNDTKQEQKWYIDRLASLRAFSIFGISGGVYTQITDCEVENNGLITYDRAFEKFTNISQLKSFAHKLYPIQSLSRTVLSSGHFDATQEWHYTTAAPTGNWTQSVFDDSHWSKGFSGFGNKSTPYVKIYTEWHTNDIWIRRKFVIPEGKLPKNPVLYLFYDDAAQVYINGVKVDNEMFDPYQVRYVAFDVDPHVFKVGENSIAVHCNQLWGGQGIDVGILDVCNDDCA